MRAIFLFVIFSLPAFAAIDSGVKLKYTVSLALNKKQAERAEVVAEQISDWLEHWAWTESATGTFEIYFAPKKEVPTVARGMHSALGPFEDGISQLFLFWDVIERSQTYTAITAFEHVVGHIYRVAHLGPKPVSNVKMADRLMFEGVYLALASLRRSPVYKTMNAAARAYVDAEIDAHFAMAAEGLSEAQLQSLNCGRAMSGRLQ